MSIAKALPPPTQGLSLVAIIDTEALQMGTYLDADLIFKNQSETTLQFTYFKPHMWLPEVTDISTGRRLQVQAEVYDGPAQAVHVVLKPGEEYQERSWPLYFLAADEEKNEKDEEKKKNESFVVCQPRKYQFQFALKLDSYKKNDWEGTLVSNQLQIEVVDRLP